MTKVDQTKEVDADLESDHLVKSALTTAELVNHAIEVMNQAIFVCEDITTEKLKLIAGQSKWLNAILPKVELAKSFVLNEDCYFLEDFLEDAKLIWSGTQNAKLKSGYWTEELVCTQADSELNLSDSSEINHHIHLEAIAIKANDQNLLILINQSDAFIQKQKTLQSAREMMLANDKLQAQYDYLHRRLLTMLNTPYPIKDLFAPLVSAIENANFGVIVVDAQLKSLIENPAVLKIFDYASHSKKRMQSPIKTVLALMQSQLPEYDRILATGSSWSGEICWMKPPHTLKWLKVALYPVKDSQYLVNNWIFFVNDISREKYLLQRNERLTQQDLLTGLPNRHAFWQYLEQVVDAKHPFFLLYLDINNFKQINEFYGHGEGDHLLVEFSHRLKATLKKGDFIARVGGDEFAIIFNGVSSVKECDQLGQRLLAVTHLPFYTEAGEQYSAGICIGATGYPIDGETPEELLKFADLSAYNGRLNNKNTIQFYSQKMKDASRKRILLESALRQAIDNNEFSLLLQPILNLKTETIEKAEVLIRWHRPGYGLVMPSDFIEVAEQTGLIVDLGKWVFNQAVAYLKQLESMNLAIKLSINLSPLQVMDKAFFEFIKGNVEKWDVNPSYLELEVTEGTLISDYEEIYKLLTLVRGLGLTVAVDDFGTGYSSLAYLKKLPIDFLKIDRSFVKDIVTDSNDKAIVMAVIAMAHQLRLGVIAEGVETKEQKLFLSNNGCDAAQGYLFSRPVSFEALVELLKLNCD